MSKLSSCINVTILLISFSLLPNAAGKNDFSFLIKICYKKHYSHCLGTYVRPNFILTTDPCAWYVNTLLHRNSFLVGGNAKDETCDVGDKKKAEKVYVDGQTFRNEPFRKISLIKMATPFEMNNNLQMVNVTLAEEESFKERKIKKCDIYAYKHNEGTLQAFSAKIVGKEECNNTFSFLINIAKVECLEIQEQVNIVNSPVVCGGAVEGFIIQIKGRLAAFIKTAAQGNWISIIADGKTLKVAMTFSSSISIKLNIILYLCFIIFHIINGNII